MTHRTEITDFEDFWLHFLSGHTRSATRWAHVAGLAAGVTGAVIAVRRGSVLPAAVGAGLLAALAVGAHPVFEGNWPENLGRPLWGARGFMRLCVRTVTGAVEADLERAKARRGES